MKTDCTCKFNGPEGHSFEKNCFRYNVGKSVNVYQISGLDRFSFGQEVRHKHRYRYEQIYELYYNIFPALHHLRVLQSDFIEIIHMVIMQMCETFRRVGYGPSERSE